VALLNSTVADASTALSENCEKYVLNFTRVLGENGPCCDLRHFSWS